MTIAVPPLLKTELASVPSGTFGATVLTWAVPSAATISAKSGISPAGPAAPPPPEKMGKRAGREKGEDPGGGGSVKKKKGGAARARAAYHMTAEDESAQRTEYATAP